MAKVFGRAVVMGLSWAFLAANVALLIEEGIDPNGEIVDVWVAALVYPAFAGGIIFSMLLRLAEGRRPLAEVPLTRAAIWGALSGTAVAGLIALLLWATLEGPPREPGPRPVMFFALTGVMTLAFAATATVWVGLARWMAPGIALSMRPQ